MYVERSIQPILLAAALLLTALPASARERRPTWKFDAQELARRNSHGVSEQIIRGQISHYEHGITVADVLKADRR